MIDFSLFPYGRTAAFPSPFFPLLIPTGFFLFFPLAFIFSLYPLVFNPSSSSKS